MPVDPRLILPAMWKEVVLLGTSRRDVDGAPGRISANLDLIDATIDFDRYDSVHLLISDTFWLMNNAALAALSRKCRRAGRKFWFSILDEGAVLYTSAELNLKRSLRALARSVYLRSHGLPTALIGQRNANYRHPLCRTAYCLHPELLVPAAPVTFSRIFPDEIEEIYGDIFGKATLPPSSAVYVSQPLYGRIGMKRQAEIVKRSCEELRAQGASNFYYKLHHFDTPQWKIALQDVCGLEPLPCISTFPIEVWARECNAAVIFGHFSSALLNLKSYGFKGRVVASGLEQVREAFHESAQFEAYKSALIRMGDIEMIELAALRNANVDANGMPSAIEEST